MTTQQVQQMTHQGWEDYYANSEHVAWKEAPEAFLIENMHTLSPVNENLLILDIACGDGRNTFVWIGNGNTVCCNDISETALRKIQDMEICGRTLLLHGDFSKMELLGKQFDIIQCFDGLPQMPDVTEAIRKMADLTKPGGKVLFNIFTPNDAAWGEGEQVSKNAFIYKETFFSFFTLEEVEAILPDSLVIEKHEKRQWQDPPHGSFRPYPHTHEAIFFILKKI